MASFSLEELKHRALTAKRILDRTARERLKPGTVLRAYNDDGDVVKLKVEAFHSSNEVMFVGSAQPHTLVMLLKLNPNL